MVSFEVDAGPSTNHFIDTKVIYKSVLQTKPDPDSRDVGNFLFSVYFFDFSCFIYFQDTGTQERDLTYRTGGGGGGGGAGGAQSGLLNPFVQQYSPLPPFTQQSGNEESEAPFEHLAFGAGGGGGGGGGLAGGLGG